MIKFCQFGVGLIGSAHAANIAKNPNASLRYVVDLDAGAARRAAEKYGAEVATDVASVLADPEVDAVLIASPTNTHAELLTAAAKAGKAIFCEMPIDLDIKRVDDCLREIEKAGVPVASASIAVLTRAIERFTTRYARVGWARPKWFFSLRAALSPHP